MVARILKWREWLAILGIFGITGCGGAISGNGSMGGSKIDLPKQEPRSGGIELSNLVSSPRDMRVGDALFVDWGNNASSSISFTGVSDESEFFLIVGSAAQLQTGKYTLKFAGDESVASLGSGGLAKAIGIDEPGSEEMAEESGNLGLHPDATELFHDALRVREKELLWSEVPHTSSNVSLATAKAASAASNLQEGSLETFRVLASLYNFNSFVEVEGILECLTPRVAFYVDKRVKGTKLSESDVRGLCQEFDSVVEKEVALFGEASDFNGDGRVAVLMTPQVNKLGGMGGGIITGFFNPNDLYSQSSSNPASNFREILYVLVPDPEGGWGAQVSKSFAMDNLLPAVLPHELQHAISYYQRVFKNGLSSQAAWLNEGCSHLAEDILGYNQENPSRYSIYLKNPQAYSLVTAGQPNLASRGASYLFLRYLYEQHPKPEKFLSQACTVDATGLGIENLEKAFANLDPSFDEFGEMFLRWSIALALTDRGISQDPRFVYKPRSRHAETGNWSGVMMIGDAQDGRSTHLNGVPTSSFQTGQSTNLKPTTAKFFRLQDLTEKTIQLEAPSNGYSFGALVRVK